MTKQATPPSAAAALHIFKAGTHTDMAGASHAFSEADLRAIAAAYQPTLHEAPLVVGHPTTDAPAYGWVQALEYREATAAAQAGLYAIAAQVVPAFAEQVNAGAYKKISSSFYPPDHPSNPAPGQWYLRHVGFLGAQPPAVKGLRTPSFADAAAPSAAADASKTPALVSLTFDFADAHLDAQDAQGALDAREAQSAQGAPDARGASAKSPEQVTQPATNPKEEPVANTNHEDLTKVQADLAAAQARVAALEREKSDAHKASVQAANAAFAESLVAKAQLPQAAKDVLAAALTHLELSAPAEFGEGDKKQPLHAALKAAVSGLPPMVQFGEVATHAAAGGAAGGASAVVSFADPATQARAEAHTRIQAYAAQHKVDYATAANAVLGKK